MRNGANHRVFLNNISDATSCAVECSAFSSRKPQPRRTGECDGFWSGLKALGHCWQC